MTTTDFICLSPLLILAAAPLIIMAGVTIRRNFRLAYSFSVFIYAAAFFSLFFVAPFAPHHFNRLLIIDHYGILFLGIIYLAALLITIFSYEYLKIQSIEREEYFIVMFVSVLGASVLIMAEHFVTFFLGLEVLSVSIYVMIAYIRWRDYSIEAGIKFLIIASVSTALMLFGMGLIYADTGTMIFSELLRSQNGVEKLSPAILAGAGLILTAIGFKLALAPFHMWTPDVYQGAPVPVTSFIATVSKGSVLALALRLFIGSGLTGNSPFMIILTAISIVSMFTGNFLALMQTNLKRLLAYSSIAQLGYLVITLIASSESGIEAAIFYISAYIITTLAAFGVIAALSVCERDADTIEDVKGLFWQNPWLASVLSIAMLSLTGIPLTAGFMSKFYLVLSGVNSGLWLLAISLVINSAISLFYYLRVIRNMFAEVAPRKKLKIPLSVNLVLLVLFAGMIVLGLMPSLLMSMIISSIR
jgi:NADH-quinone oxidoreductase subunit N